MVKELVKKHYDLKMGLLGAVVMGGVVYWVNADHGFWAAIPAGLKQAFYTAIAGGFLSRLCENTACHYDNKVAGVIMGMLVPSALAIIMTYIVHMIKGTPEPFNSTVPTMVLAPISFWWWGWRTRNIYDKKLEKGELSSEPT